MTDAISLANTTVHTSGKVIAFAREGLREAQGGRRRVWERFEDEHRAWLELDAMAWIDAMAMTARTELDVALRSQTLTRDGRDYLLRVDDTGLTAPADRLRRASGAGLAVRLRTATEQIESADTAIHAWRRADAALYDPAPASAGSLEEVGRQQDQEPAREHRLQQVQQGRRTKVQLDIGDATSARQLDGYQ